MLSSAAAAVANPSLLALGSSAKKLSLIAKDILPSVAVYRQSLVRVESMVLSRARTTTMKSVLKGVMLGDAGEIARLAIVLPEEERRIAA